MAPADRARCVRPRVDASGLRRLDLAIDPVELAELSAVPLGSAAVLAYATFGTSPRPRLALAKIQP